MFFFVCTIFYSLPSGRLCHNSVPLSGGLWLRDGSPGWPIYVSIGLKSTYSRHSRYAMLYQIHRLSQQKVAAVVVVWVLTCWMVRRFFSEWESLLNMSQTPESCFFIPAWPPLEKSNRLLRMAMKPYNSLLRSWLYTPCSSCDKVIGSLGLRR